MSALKLLTISSLQVVACCKMQQALNPKSLNDSCLGADNVCIADAIVLLHW